MSKSFKYIFLVILLISCRPTKKTADLILLNGKILTLNDSQKEVTALATKGDRILAIGRDAKISSYIGSETEVIDLEGKLAIPGLIEGHGHYMRLGKTLTQLNLMKVESWGEVVQLVEDAVKVVKNGEWILGWGWHQDKWEKLLQPSVQGLPIHDGLSAVSPNNPVMLSHASGHGIFANKQAMNQAGITLDTPDPDGGEIVRDRQGNAIGMFRESAADLIKNAYLKYLETRPPEDVAKEKQRHIQLAAREALANGITSFQDMGSSFETIDLSGIFQR